MPSKKRTTKRSQRRLTPEEERMQTKLKESGLDLNDADTLGLTAVTEAESSKLGLHRSGAGIKIPYVGLDGKLKAMFRYRYFDCEAKNGFLAGVKLRKYDQPRDTNPEVYFPQMAPWAEIMADPNIPLTITEGEFKAACLTKNFVPCIGVGGVYSFGRKVRGQKLLPELEEAEWRGRKVHIIYDSDAVTNPNVIIAENRLAKYLSDEGSKIHVVRLPQEGDIKVGCDDYVVKHGIEALQTLMAETPDWGELRELYRLNGEVAYIHHPSMVCEFPKDDHPTDQTRYRMYPVPKFVNEAYAPRTMAGYNAKGEAVIKRAAKEWIEWPARNALDSVVYSPSAPTIMGKQLNLWEGWGASPVKGDIGPWKALLEYVFKSKPDDAHWFQQWLAYPLQNPGAKLNTATVMWSVTQGSGKSIIGYTMGRIYGHNYGEVNKNQLESGFNGWAANKQFIMGEEITGGSGREVADVLKNMITGKDILVNAKYQPTYTIKNCINYYFTSNHQDAFFVSHADRRYFIHEITGAKLPETFWKVYDRWMWSEDGPNALFYHLLNYDTSTFNPQAEAPHTEARGNMIEAGLSEHAAWVKELKDNPDNCLRQGNIVLPFSLFTAEELLGLYSPADKPRSRYISAKAISIALKEAGFHKYPGPVATLNGMRQYIWFIRDDDKLKRMSPAQLSFVYNEERSKKNPLKKFQRGK